MSGTINSILLEQAANNRHGLVFKPQIASLSASDIDDVIHVGVPDSVSDPWKSAAGGVAYDLGQARRAAIAEGIERYAASIIRLPLKKRQQIRPKERLNPEDWTLFSNEQRRQDNFPFGNIYDKNMTYTNVYSLKDNKQAWVPHALVGLRDDYQTGLPTSSGLAAGQNLHIALLRAIEELIERDALMSTWLHCLPGRKIGLTPKMAKQVSDLMGEVQAFDLTPAYSPLPVIAVAGGIPKRGQMRYSLGIACRESLAQALEKAFLEWCQGVFFAGIYPKYVKVGKLKKPNEVNAFDDHAIYYTVNPEEWAKLPLFKRESSKYEPTYQNWQHLPTQEVIRQINKRLLAKGIRLYYRDLTTIDALQAGVRVIRALSPDLIPINAHHSQPFIGGNASNLRLRYKDLESMGDFPNRFPHPLG